MPKSANQQLLCETERKKGAKIGKNIAAQCV